MKLKKVLVGIFACLTVGALALGFTGCGKDKVGNSVGSTGLPNMGINNGGGTNIGGGSNNGGTVEKKPSEGLKYTISADKTYYEVSGIGACTDMDIVIPSTYEGLPVTSIGSMAFFNYSSLTGVVIPDSVTSIGASAFFNCSNLTSISVSTDNVNYQSIDGNLYTKDGKTLVQYAIGKTATSFIVLDSVTSIGDYAFFNCSSLLRIVMPDSVTSIGDSAFFNCSSLSSLVIPDNVTSIGDDAFFNCDMTSVVIPDGVTNIGYTAFSDCSNLTSITVSTGNVNYQSIDGNLYTKDGKTLVQYAIGKTATSFTIPDSVTNIGSSSFEGCSSLMSVVIPNSVTSISEYGFSCCSRLKNVIIPESVTSIGYSAFYNCSSLMSVVIPDSVTSISDAVFNGCSSLKSITFEGTVAQWNVIKKGMAWNYSVPATKVVCKDGEVAL